MGKNEPSLTSDTLHSNIIPPQEPTFLEINDTQNPKSHISQKLNPGTPNFNGLSARNFIKPAKD